MRSAFLRLPGALALIAIVSCLVLASCRGEDDDDDGERGRAACSQAVTAAPAAELRFQVPEEASSRASDVGQVKSALCARFRSLGLEDVQVETSGAGELVVRAPEELEPDVRRAAMPGELHVYDWEPNVIGDRGPDQPFAGGGALYAAVNTASRAEPRAEATDVGPGAPSGLSREEADRRNDTSEDRYYLFGPDRRLIAGPAPTRGELAEPGGKRPLASSQVLKVPRGIVVVEAERAARQPQSVQRYFVLEDDSELSTSGIRNPQQGNDSQTQEPIVTMEFTDTGRQALASLTRRIAARGAQTILPPGVERDAALQRFAITLDNAVLSLATIDFRELPEGIDGRTGMQINGVGSVSQARRLARLLKLAPLPAELVPLSPR